MTAKKTVTKELWAIISLTFIETGDGCPLIKKYTKKPTETTVKKDTEKWCEDNIDSEYKDISHETLLVQIHNKFFIEHKPNMEKDKEEITDWIK